jgi:hypothetical protein
VRITERHYSPWVRAGKEQLEQDLKRVWEQDPVALMESKGTPDAHGKNSSPNSFHYRNFGGSGGNRTLRGY